MMFYGEIAEKIQKNAFGMKKIIENSHFAGYNNTGEKRGERLNPHRKLLDKQFSPTRLHTRVACRACDQSGEYQKLLKTVVFS